MFGGHLFLIFHFFTQLGIPSVLLHTVRNEVKQISLTPKKLWVHEDLTSGLHFLDKLKVIHVHLSKKRADFAIFEILWSNLLHELIAVLDVDSVALSGPRDYIISAYVLHYIVESMDEITANEKRG